MRVEFRFFMNADVNMEFRKKIVLVIRIIFETSYPDYANSNLLKNAGYDDIAIAHHKKLSWMIK